MPKQQAFNLGRTMTVIALIGCLISAGWALLPGTIGLALVWYGSTD
jgi:hypothetical protein